MQDHEPKQPKTKYKTKQDQELSELNNQAQEKPRTKKGKEIFKTGGWEGQPVKTDLTARFGLCSASACMSENAWTK